MLVGFLAVFLAGNSTAGSEDFQISGAPDDIIVISPTIGQADVSKVESPGRSPWRFSQWNIPDPITSVQKICDREALQFRSHSSSIGFSVTTKLPCTGSSTRQAAPNSQAIFRIQQNGAGLPCSRGGVPLEYDALFAPQPASYPAGILKATLADTYSVRQRIVIKIDSSNEPQPNAPCQVNQRHAITSLVYTNTVGRQNFFYQLTLFSEGLRTATPSFWWATGQSGVGEWRSKQGVLRFGFQDSLHSFGMAPPRAEREITLDIKLLDRIRQVILEGAKYGLEQDMNRWRFSGIYFGQAVWGGSKLSSTWTNYELWISTR